MPNETILVVDDSKEVCRFLQHSVLEPAGYRVLTANDGNTGVRAALRHNPDLLLLDINLPGRSGLDVLRTLVAQGYSQPAIIMTSHGSEEAILQSFRLGAKDFLQKPFSAQDMLESAAKVLDESRWQQERAQMTEALADANRKLQEQIRAWATLNEIGRAITSTLDEADVQRRLMVGINQLMQVQAGSLYLADPKTGELVLQVSLRGGIEKKREIRLLPGQGIAGWVAKHKRPALVPDAHRDKRFYPGVDRKNTDFLTRSVLAVPLTVKGVVLGVIQVINPHEPKSQFDQADQELLEALAASVSVAVENARLHATMRQTVTLDTLRKTVATLSHYINNSLTVLSLTAHTLQAGAKDGQNLQEPGWLKKPAATVQEETIRGAAIIAALNQVTSPRSTVYVGETQMIDIERELRARLAAMTKRPPRKDV